MAQQIPLDPHDRAEDRQADKVRDHGTHEICADLAYRRLAIVNVILYGVAGAGDRGWVLIDTGVVGMSGRIVEAARDRFGENARPAAIIQTHGHFDHVGGLEDLAERWNAPVYAHPLERPYLDGSASYPPPDSSIGDGLMSLLSPLYPLGPVNVGHRLHNLPEDGTVLAMSGWLWLQTPGIHSIHPVRCRFGGRQTGPSSLPTP